MRLVGGIDVEKHAGSPFRDIGALPGGPLGFLRRRRPEAPFEFRQRVGIEGMKQAVQAECVVGNKRRDQGQVGPVGILFVGFQHALRPTAGNEHILVHLDV